LEYWESVCKFLDNGDINNATELLNKKKSFGLKVINYKDQFESEFSIN
jgi:hypothetical protein